MKGTVAMKNCMKLTATVILLTITFSPQVTTAQSGCTAADSGPNHHDGTFVGNPPPECVEGISGAALLFDGAQNFVNVPNDAALYPQTSFTLETWFKTTARGGPVLGCLSSTAGYELAINSDFGFQVFQGRFQNTAYFGTAGPGNVVDGNWHHLAATWDGATRTVRVFTDGVLGETKTTAGPLVVGTLPLSFGKSGSAFPLGPVTIDEVRLSDTVRYTGNFTPQHSYVVDSHTVGYWSFGVCESDTPPPTIVCPDDIVATNDAGQCSAVVNYTATASDDCSGIASLSENFPSGSSFPAGATTVTVTAVDGSGNSNSCSFTVTV